jgi:hypothetical protein
MVKGAFLKRVYRATLLALGLGVLGSGQGALAQDAGGWKLEPSARVEIGAVSAETATRDEQIVVDGDALTLRGQVGLDLANASTRLRIEADRIEVVRLGDGRPDTRRDRFTAQLEQKLGNGWEIQLRGRYYDDLVSAEANDTDELSAAISVVWERDRTHRLQLSGSWRSREYDNGTGGQTNGEGPRVDAQYRYRFGRYHYLTFDLRSESIDSADPERGYARASAGLAYTQPITRDLRVRPALEYLATRFDGRLTDGGAQREDTLVVPELELHWWPGPWRVEAEAKYILSGSNLPTREREGYRLTVSIGYVF